MSAHGAAAPERGRARSPREVGRVRGRMAGTAAARYAKPGPPAGAGWAEERDALQKKLADQEKALQSVKGVAVALTRANAQLKEKVLQLEGATASLEDASLVKAQLDEESVALRRENEALARKLDDMEALLLEKTESWEETEAMLKAEQGDLKAKLVVMKDELAAQRATASEQVALSQEREAALAKENRQLAGKLRDLQAASPRSTGSPVSSASVKASRLAQAEAIATARCFEALVKPSSDMDPEMRDCAVEHASTAMRLHSGFNEIAEDVGEQFRKAYGGVWQCVVGLTGQVGFSIWRADRAYVSLSFGDVSILLFKAVFEPRGDLIARARAEEAVVKDSTMTEGMRAQAVERAREALRSHSRFGDVMRALREDVQSSFGGLWTCVVALEGFTAFGFRHPHSAYLYVTFGKISVILLKVQQAHLPPADLIATAQEAEAVVRCSTVPAAAEECALKAVRAAVQGQRSLAAVAGKVQEEVERCCGGSWFCIVGAESHIGTWLAAANAMLLQVNLGELQMVLMKAQARRRPHAEHIAAAGQAEVEVRGTTAMREALQRLAIDRARLAFQEASTFGEVAQAVRAELQGAEGAGGGGGGCGSCGSVWQCVVGVHTHVGFSVISANGAFFSAIFGDVVVTVFQAPHEEQSEILATALLQEPAVKNSTVPEHLERSAVESAVAALRLHQNFTSVAQALREDLQRIYGGVWQCIVGLDAFLGFHVSFLAGALLQISFGDLRLVLFRAQPELQADVLSASRSEEGQVSRSTDMPVELQRRAVECARRALRERGDFGGVAVALRESFEDAGGDAWQCVVGLSGQTGMSLVTQEHSFLSASFGAVKVVVFQARGA